LNSFGYVYEASNLKNGRLYVGQKKGKVVPCYLGSGLLISKAIKKHGRKSFKLNILAYADSREELDKLEINFIAEYKKQFGDRLYNISAGGVGVRRPCPEFVKEKIRQATLKQMSDPAVRKLLSEKAKQRFSIPQNNPMYGKKASELCKFRTRLANFGKRATEEARNKMRITHRVSHKPFSEEHKNNLREARARRKMKLGYLNSPETRIKMSSALRGQKRSPETCEKIRQARIGKHFPRRAQ
jgi:group I intron endonuclease